MLTKLFNYKYLTAEHLKGFNNYKYNAIDTNPLSVYVMHPFWNRVVELAPKWVAPNLLTFVGFLFTVLDFALLSWYDFHFYAASDSTLLTSNVTTLGLSGEEAVVIGTRVPWWCWFLLSVFLFLAYTLDGIDGKQARRTGTSGPIGELFDHGLDSYSVFFIPVCLYSVFGRLDYSVSTMRMYFVLWNVMLNFYISHWEKYNTGVLFLPWGYDFSMWGGCTVFLVASVYGTDLFKVSLFSGLTAAHLFEIGIYATGLLTTIPISLYNVHLSYKNKTGKMRSTSEAWRPLCSLLSVMIVLIAWSVFSPNKMADTQPRALMLLTGTLFSSVTCRLIVAQMSGQRCELFCWLLLPTTAAALSSMVYPGAEIRILYGYTAFVIAAHVHYGACAVRQMCEHFRIDCFHIKIRSD